MHCRGQGTLAQADRCNAITCASCVVGFFVQVHHSTPGLACVGSCWRLRQTRPVG